MAEEMMDDLEGLEAEGNADEDAQKGKYMTFQIGDEYYGIAINYVNEIVNIQSITGVPEVEDYIKGLIKDTLKNYLWQRTKRSPMILPIIMEV